MTVVRFSQFVGRSFVLRICAFLIGIFPVGAYSQALTEEKFNAGTLANSVKSKGFEKTEEVFLSRERPSLLFKNSRSLGVFFSLEKELFIGLSVMGDKPNRVQSLGMDLLFRGFENFEGQLIIIEDVLNEAGFQEGVRNAALDLIRLEQSKLPTKKPCSHFPKTKNFAVIRKKMFQIDLEAKFSCGPGGSGGLLSLQFTDSVAKQTKWPHPRDIEKLQPYSRYFRYWGPGQHSQLEIMPEVVSLHCRKRTPGKFRCRYRNSVTDWIGDDRPSKRYSDTFRFTAADGWIME